MSKETTLMRGSWLATVGQFRTYTYKNGDRTNHNHVYKGGVELFIGNGGLNATPIPQALRHAMKVVAGQ